MAVGLLALGVAGPAAAQSQSKETIDYVKHATVLVFTAHSKQTAGDTKLGSGSGYLVNGTGLCITNNHVTDPGHGKSEREKFELKNTLGRLVWTVVVDSGTEDEIEYNAHLLYANEKADQAVLQVYDEDGEFLEWDYYLGLVPGRQLKVGQKIWCYGFPGGDSRKADKDRHAEVAITSGHIFDLPRRPDGDIKMIFTDVLANPGNSGGPMVDKEGNVVGTLTLGSQSEGRKDTTMLVPADLTRAVINEVFRRGKMPAGIDLEPLYTFMAGSDGHIAVPGFPRLANSDCIFLDGGERICGEPAAESLVLDTPLGKLTLPGAQLAYLLPSTLDEDYGIILMDGGQRVPFLLEGSEVRFKTAGGATFTASLEEVDAVAFRKGRELLDPPTGRMVLLGGSQYHLLLAEVSGNIKLTSDIGVELSMPLQNIASIEWVDEETHAVRCRDGSQLSGTFSEDPVDAVLAINEAPLKISLAQVRDVTVELIDTAERDKLRALAELYLDATPELREIARILDTGEVDRAREKLERFKKPDYFRQQGRLRQDQIRLLDGFCLWRKGNWKEAERQFRKLKGSKDDGLKWYAVAVLAVYDRFSDGKYKDKPLHEPKTFRKAGMIVAQDHVRRAIEVLGEREAPAPENRLLFMRLRRKFEDSTQELMVASRLDHPQADDAMVQVWTFEKNVLAAEMRRLTEEIGEKQEELQGLSGRARDYRGRQIEADIKSLERNREATGDWLQAAMMRLRGIGFIINDPDREIIPQA